MYFSLQHFQQMAEEDGLFSVYSTRDSLMWLWRAHNKVNKRIAGDITEDPLHPKRQFPDKELCPECFDGDTYDTFNVPEFLLEFYASENFRGEGLDPVPVANLPSVNGHVSSDATGQAAGHSMLTAAAQTPPSSHQQEPSSVASGGQSTTQQRVPPFHTHTSPDHHAAPQPASAPVPRPPSAADQHGSSSVLSVQTHRAPHLFRSSHPPPAVLPPQPGRHEVVPGIMRYPSEMNHVFPKVVRVAPDEEDEAQQLGAGLTRTQRRVVHARPKVVYGSRQVMTTKPRVVYAKPRVVYTRPRVVYTRPRVVDSQPRVMLPLYPEHRVVHPAHRIGQNVHGSSEMLQRRIVVPARNTQSSSRSVRTYWVRGYN